MRFIFAAAASIVAALAAAEPTANPQPRAEAAHAHHGMAKRWNGFGAWGCGCPFYGGFRFGTGVGCGVGFGYCVGTSIFH
ncbi:hypothetical protein GGI24_000772 [Coemansia furcata]|nr:hypothetical protein GGI24_000772 [Coemansia furcata]